MAPSILCFAGRSNSGKTTLIERVIPALTRAGYRVATVKHAGHGFELDTEGKDSWRHKQAGASAVVVLSKGSMAMFADVSEEMKVEEVRDKFLDSQIDLIIAEGWKSEGYPKIAVVREELSELNTSLDGLMAIVSMKPITASVPCFDRDDIEGIANLIIQHCPKRSSE
jgi:molybdopterin-guanine dinucleotide biosynthesis protein B